MSYSVIHKVSIFSSVSVTEQTGLSLTWFDIMKTRFNATESHIELGTSLFLYQLTCGVICIHLKRVGSGRTVLRGSLVSLSCRIYEIMSILILVNTLIFVCYQL